MASNSHTTTDSNEKPIEECTDTVGPEPQLKHEPEKVMDAHELELFLRCTLDECDRLSKQKATNDQRIAMAKMIKYCIRMLHSEGWIPRTVIRAMVKMELCEDEKVSVRGMLYRSLRERRDEKRRRWTDTREHGGQSHPTCFSYDTTYPSQESCRGNEARACNGQINHASSEPVRTSNRAGQTKIID